MTADMEIDDIPMPSSSGSFGNAKSELPWVEKYRPSTLDDLIAHDDIITILNQLIESNKLPHLLFYGPPGTGNYNAL
jgi:replication factor C subunit 3/5